MLESIAHSAHNNTCLGFISIARGEKILYLPDGLNNLRHLRQIQIECFRNLVSIPRLPSTSLKVLRLSWCRKLEALPYGMHNLTSLQELELSNCTCLLSFPEEGFPTNLTSLTISKPEILEGLINWGLHKLTSLERLTIRGGYSNGVSFPHEEKGTMLPSVISQMWKSCLQRAFKTFYLLNVCALLTFQTSDIFPERTCLGQFWSYIFMTAQCLNKGVKGM
ncbi:hypothetical protein PTKIN_Ptkin01aG0240700 [Pterospermum kingtungense]